MKINKIKELTDEELRDRIEEETLNYTKMKLTHTISPLESGADLKKARQFVARMKTELRQRELSNKE